MPNIWLNKYVNPGHLEKNTTAMTSFSGWHLFFFGKDWAYINSELPLKECSSRPETLRLCQWELENVPSNGLPIPFEFVSHAVDGLDVLNAQFFADLPDVHIQRPVIFQLASFPDMIEDLLSVENTIGCWTK